MKLHGILKLTVKRFLFRLKYQFLKFFCRSKFEVVVLTRFNTSSDFNNHELILDENYLKSRFYLFEKYYLPSILNQTDKDFKVAVVLHPETPDCFKEKMKTYENLFKGRFKTFYSETFQPDKVLKETVKAPWVMSVRLDNDDSLAEDFIEVLKKHFSPASNAIIDFRFGAKYLESEDRGRLYNYTYGTHFLAKIENAGGEMTSAFSLKHPDASKEVEYIKIKTKMPMWLEVIHGLNCGNTFEEGLFELSFDAVKRFHIGEISSFF